MWWWCGESWECRVGVLRETESGDQMQLLSGCEHPSSVLMFAAWR